MREKISRYQKFTIGVLSSEAKIPKVDAESIRRAPVSPRRDASHHLTTPQNSRKF